MSKPIVRHLPVTHATIVFTQATDPEEKSSTVIETVGLFPDENGERDVWGRLSIWNGDLLRVADMLRELHAEAEEATP